MLPRHACACRTAGAGRLSAARVPQVTGRIIWEPPTPLQRVPLADAGGGGGGDWLLLEHEDDRVMPSCRALMAAGRYDLHHAVTYWGGYRAARAPPAPPPPPMARAAAAAFFPKHRSVHAGCWRGWDPKTLALVLRFPAEAHQ